MSNTYYVKPAGSGGSDAAAGTSIGTAWATIQKAANTMVAGDTCKIDSGTYTNGFIAVNSGTALNRITFEPYVGTGHYSDSGIIITGFLTASGQLGPVWIFGKSYITVKGFNCTTNTGKGQFQVSTGADGCSIINCRSYGGNNHWGIKVTLSDDVTCQGNLCQDSSGEHGIYYSGSLRGVIRGNTCHGNAWDGIHTNIDDDGDHILFENDDHLIEDNVCYDNTLSGMDLTAMVDSVVRNNLVYENGNHAISVQNASGQGVMRSCSGNVFVNNTLLCSGGASRAAIRFAATQNGTLSNDANTTVFNNLLLGTAGSGSLEHYGGVDSTFKSDYNIVCDVFRVTSGSDITFSSWKSSTGEDANSSIATAANLFTNSATDDYTLKVTSPAIAFGQLTFNGATAPTDDIAGTLRGAAADAGAYEFAADSGGGAAANTYFMGRHRPGRPRGLVYTMGMGMGRR